MKKLIVVGALLLLVALESFGSVGIGVKLLNGNTLCITGEVGGERLSVELGVGLRSVNVPGVFNWTMIWYSGVARLAFPMGAFAPYVGVGGIGVSIILDSAEGSGSLSALGITGEGGLRYSFEELGFPLRLSAGPNISWIPVSGDVEDVGIGGIGLGWHIGAVVSF
jgi:hypothetical protein